LITFASENKRQLTRFNTKKMMLEAEKEYPMDDLFRFGDPEDEEENDVYEDDEFEFELDELDASKEVDDFNEEEEEF